MYVVLMPFAGQYSVLENHETPKNALSEFEDKFANLPKLSGTVESILMQINSSENNTYDSICT